MEHHCLRRRVRPGIATICLGLLLCALPAATAFAEGPSTVQGPSADAACFRPWGKNTTYFQWKKKPGPFRIALANGFIGNTWRIQMIKTAKAFADQPAVKAKLKEFKVISTGEDLPAQIAAANNLIDAGYDAVIVNALNPTAFACQATKETNVPQYSVETIEAMQKHLLGYRDNLRVEVELGIPIVARTVAELRTLSTWPGPLVLDVLREIDIAEPRDIDA